MRAPRRLIPVFVICVACIAVGALTGSTLAAPDITGRWAASFETPIGRMDYTYDFVVKGGTLTGKLQSSMFGESEIREGKVEGETVTFVEMLDSSIRVEYKGRIVSADEIAFTRTVGDFGTEELTAKRVRQ